MKKAKMRINFRNDTISAFGENMSLITTISAHYVIPLTQATQFINDIDRESPIWVTLMIAKKAMALKPHCQSAHPTPDKFINSINNAEIPWSNKQWTERRNTEDLTEIIHM